MDFFSSHNGNAIRDWVDYDPRVLVQALRGYVRLRRKWRRAWWATSIRRSIRRRARWSTRRREPRVLHGRVQGRGGHACLFHQWPRPALREGTEFTSSGAAQTVISAACRTAWVRTTIALSPVVPISFDGDYTDFLPSLNVKFDLTDDLVARFSASKVMTRPTLSDLSPAPTILSNPGNETINRGNPDLDPFRAQAGRARPRVVLRQLERAVGRGVLQGHRVVRRRRDLTATGRSGRVPGDAASERQGRQR